MAKKITKKDLKKKLKSTTATLEEHSALLEELRTSVSELQERVRQTERRLHEAEGSEERRSSASPDQTWTVEQLRAEARRREIPNYSTKNKAGLLAALR